MGGDNVRGKGKGFSETSIKDTWTKPKWGRIMADVGVWRGKMETIVLEQQ